MKENQGEQVKENKAEQRYSKDFLQGIILVGVGAFVASILVMIMLGTWGELGMWDLKSEAAAVWLSIAPGLAISLAGAWVAIKIAGAAKDAQDQANSLQDQALSLQKEANRLTEISIRQDEEAVRRTNIAIRLENESRFIKSPQMQIVEEYIDKSNRLGMALSKYYLEAYYIHAHMTKMITEIIQSEGGKYNNEGFIVGPYFKKMKDGIEYSQWIERHHESIVTEQLNSRIANLKKYMGDIGCCLVELDADAFSQESEMSRNLPEKGAGQFLKRLMENMPAQVRRQLIGVERLHALGLMLGRQSGTKTSDFQVVGRAIKALSDMESIKGGNVGMETVTLENLIASGSVIFNIGAVWFGANMLLGHSEEDHDISDLCLMLLVTISELILPKEKVTEMALKFLREWDFEIEKINELVNLHLKLKIKPTLSPDLLQVNDVMVESIFPQIIK